MAVAAFPRDAAPTTTVAGSLAAWPARGQRRRAPADVRHAAQRCIVDVTGCAIAAASFPPLPALLALARTEARSGHCALLFAEDRFGPLATAELNAAAAHALDFDDTCYAGIAHCSAVVWPAVLAAAQVEHASGARAVDAFISGVEAAYALGKAFGNALYLERGWWTTAYLGAIGAAVACADVLELSAVETRDAICLAASGSIVVRALLGSHAKPYRCGASARDGIRAAFAGRAGLRGPVDVFEHQLGAIAALNGGSFDSTRLGRLGSEWSLLTPGVAFKRFPVCSAAQAAAQATLEVLDEAKASASDIDTIACAVPPLVSLSLIYPDPRTPSEAQFSLPFAVACVAMHRAIAPEHLTQKTLDEPELRSLMARVHYQTRADLGFGNDEPEGARVTLRLRDGRQFTRSVGAARGMPSNPASDEDLCAKFVRNAGGGESARTLARRLLALDREPDCDFIAFGTAA